MFGLHFSVWYKNYFRKYTFGGIDAFSFLYQKLIKSYQMAFARVLPLAWANLLFVWCGGLKISEIACRIGRSLPIFEGVLGEKGVVIAFIARYFFAEPVRLLESLVFAA